MWQQHELSACSSSLCFTSHVLPPTIHYPLPKSPTHQTPILTLRRWRCQKLMLTRRFPFDLVTRHATRFLEERAINRRMGVSVVDLQSMTGAFRISLLSYSHVQYAFCGIYPCNLLNSNTETIHRMLCPYFRLIYLPIK